MSWNDAQTRGRVARAEELLGALDTLPDNAAAARAGEALAALVELYGECLARIMAHLSRLPDGGREIAGDELVGHLLLVHDLHPDPVETRVRRALDEVSSALGGGAVELLGLDGTVARVRLSTGGGCGCGSSATADDAVEEAVMAAAPEIERVEIETAPPAPARPFVPVTSLFRDRTPAGREVR